MALSPEIQYLKTLWEQKDWNSLLETSQQLILVGGWTAEELAHLNYYACRARFAFHEFYAGLPSGELARRLAQSASAWDLLGNVLITLSAGYHSVMQYERSLEYAFDFLEKLPLFTDSRNREDEAWVRIALGYEGLGMDAQAVLAYDRARNLSGRSRRWYWAVMSTLSMAKLLYRDDPGRIPQLLGEALRLRRNAPKDPLIRAYIILERARYAWSKGDWDRCLRLAPQSADPEISPYFAFESHLLMATCLRDAGHPATALHHVTIARAVALQYKSFSQEYRAVEFIYSLMRDQGEDLTEPTVGQSPAGIIRTVSPLWTPGSEIQ